jgi:multiple sugar transport system permease protein
MPGLISAGIFSFTLSWNEFIHALAFIQSSADKTVPVAIFYSLFVDYYVSSLTGAEKE